MTILYHNILLRLALLSLILLALYGCDFQKEKNIKLTGVREDVILYNIETEPDPSLKNYNIKLPAPYVNDFWLQAGASSNHAPQHLKLGDGLQELWSRSIGEGTESNRNFRIQPVASKDVIYVMDNDFKVQALSTDDGATLWSKKLSSGKHGNDSFGGGLSLHGNMLYITTGFAKLFALNIDDGSVMWHKNLDAPSRTAPSFIGKLVVVLTINNKLSAFDNTSGNPLWSYIGIAENIGLLGGSNPAMGNGLVLFGLSSGEIISLRAANGSVKWTDSLSSTSNIGASANLSDILAPIILANNAAYALSNGNRMAKYNLRNGSRIWARNIGGAQMPWLAGDVIYMVTSNYRLLAMKENSGNVIWAQDLPAWLDPDDKQIAMIWQGPFIANDSIILLNQEGVIQFYSPYDGQLKSTITLDDNIYIRPIIVHEKIFFMTDDATLIAMG